MGNLREEAKAFEPKKTLNVADLEVLSLDSKIESRIGTDKNGEEFSYKVAIVVGNEYRVPASVLADIKTLLEAKPTLKTVKVIKKGSGMNTKYSVIPME
jgi:hypothetical protein